MLIGAHVSNAGGLARAVQRGTERGCKAIQIFNQSPRMWRPTAYREEDFAAFRAAMDDSPIDAVLIHAVYLLNCASQDQEIRGKTRASLIQSLRVGAGIGARGVVLHPGSAKRGEVGDAIKRAGKLIGEALAQSDGCELHLEDTAGAGGTLGRSFGELAQLLDASGGDHGWASAWIPATCSRRDTTSEAPPGWPRRWTSFTASWVWSACSRCTSTTRSRRWDQIATATRCWARASSVRGAARPSSQSRASKSSCACSRLATITALPQRRTSRWRRSCESAGGRLALAREGLIPIGDRTRGCRTPEARRAVRAGRSRVIEAVA